MTQNPKSFQTRWGTLTFALSVAYVNQSLKNYKIHVLRYMRASFVDQCSSTSFVMVHP